MAGQKLSPRQKMIGMMYLVLTALLALNVSKEIINAFVTIDDALNVTVNNISGKNAQAYSAFQRQLDNDKVKTKPYHDKAMKAKQLCEDLNKYILTVKDTLLRTTDAVESGVKTPTSRQLLNKDNYDIPTTLMCGSENDGKGHKATELKAKIAIFKKAMLDNLDAKDRAKFSQRLEDLFNTNDPKPNEVEDGKRTWEMATFYHNPVVASVALLTKMQTDIKNAESEVVNHLLSSINATDFKFDTLSPRVIAPTSYVLIGQEYKADVFLAAMSSTSDPEVLVGGRPLPVSGGVGTYTVRPSSDGEQKWGGIIKIKKPDNTFQEFKFESSYISAKPSSTVSADKMNVVYIGVDNPMSISVPGVAADKVKFTATGLTLTQDPKLGKGHFIGRATTVGEAVVRVSAELTAGKPVLPMGEFKFRVKKIPNPVAKIAGKRDGSISKNVLAAQSAIIPEMENFDFDLFSKVKSFKMSRYGKGRDPIEKSTEGNVLTGEMRDVINQCRAGDKVLFEYIKATMPDGTVRDINAIILTVQ